MGLDIDIYHKPTYFREMYHFLVCAVACDAIINDKEFYETFKDAYKSYTYIVQCGCKELIITKRIFKTVYYIAKATENKEWAMPMAWSGDDGTRAKEHWEKLTQILNEDGKEDIIIKAC